MASKAEDLDPVVVRIEGDEPTMTLHEWFELARADGPVDLGVSAAELLSEARAAGEV
jgi:hypothetical protein